MMSFKSTPKNACLFHVLVLIISCSFNAYANEQTTSDEVLELSIRGNNELPKVSFNLPWRLPSVEKRDEQSPTSDLSGILTPLEPDQHRKNVHFSRYLELDIPEFRAR